MPATSRSTPGRSRTPPTRRASSIWSSRSAGTWGPSSTDSQSQSSSESRPAASPRLAFSAVAPEWRNWARDQACRPAAIEHPATREEVAASVRRARDRGRSVKVEGIELVDGAGEVRELAGDEDLLRAARVGLGALGVITAVTLRTLRAFTVRRVDEPRPLAELLVSLEELCERNEHFEFFVFPHAETALAIARNRTDEPPRRRGRLAAWANDILLENYVLELLARTGRRFPAGNRDLAGLATRLLSRTERVARSHQAFASERRVRFTEMEYALPRERGAEAVCRVLDLIAERDVAVFFPIEFRLVAPDDAFLSPAYQR